MTALAGRRFVVVMVQPVRERTIVAVQHLTLRPLGLGPPPRHRDHLSRSGAWLRRAPPRRRYRLETRPRQLQSAQAYRPVRDDPAAGASAAVARPVPVRLRQ